MSDTQIRVFVLAYNVGELIPRTLVNFRRLNTILTNEGMDLQVRVIDDCSIDNTEMVLRGFAEDNPFLSVVTNKNRLGNAGNIPRGWQWALEGASSSDIVCCMDGDGEHNPLAILDYLENLDSYDGVVGSIIYPPHRTGWADQNTMRSLGAIQAKLAGANDPFYIQSPGFQVHNPCVLREVIGGLLPDYLAYLRGKGLDVPAWGMHGAILHLLGKRNARLHSAYLSCFGDAPNRSEEKLLLQGAAGYFHLQYVEEFWKETGLAA